MKHLPFTEKVVHSPSHGVTYVFIRVKIIGANILYVVIVRRLEGREPGNTCRFLSVKFGERGK